MPFFCPVLPDTPVDPRGVDPAGSGPYYVAEHDRQPAHRPAGGTPTTAGTGPANVDEIVVDRRPDPGGLPGRDRSESDRPLLPVRCPERGIRIPVREVRRQPARRAVLRRALRSGTFYLAFNHDRPAFEGPGQIPLKKAINYAIDRAALVRPLGRLYGKRTDQILPPALARRESIYPLGGPNLAAARRLYAQARLKPTTLVYYTTNAPASVVQAQNLAFQLKQIGIELEVKYFDAGNARREKIHTRGEPFDIARDGWAADYLERRVVPRNAARRQANPANRQSERRVLRRPADERQNRRGEAADRRCAAEGVGKTSTSS